MRSIPFSSCKECGTDEDHAATLKLNNVNAKDHPIYRELARTKHYFEKVKRAEERGSAQNGHQGQKNLSLDRVAAGRFVKHALSGNDKHDRERAEAQAAERAEASKKFEVLSEQIGATQRFKSAAGGEETLIKGEKRAAADEQEDGERRPKKHKRAGKKRSKHDKTPKWASEVFKGLLDRSLKNEDGADAKGG